MAKLTRRSQQLLQLLANDKTLKQAAAEMGIGISTADKVSQRIRDALDCKTTGGAIAKALAAGEINLPGAP